MLRDGLGRSILHKAGEREPGTLCECSDCQSNVHTGVLEPSLLHAYSSTLACFTCGGECIKRHVGMQGCTIENNILLKNVYFIMLPLLITRARIRMLFYACINTRDMPFLSGGPTAPRNCRRNGVRHVS